MGDGITERATFPAEARAQMNARDELILEWRTALVNDQSSGGLPARFSLVWPSLAAVVDSGFNLRKLTGRCSASVGWPI